jgi:hypothetical protein
LPPELPWLTEGGARRCALLIPPPRLDESNDCWRGGGASRCGGAD